MFCVAVDTAAGGEDLETISTVFVEADFVAIFGMNCFAGTLDFKFMDGLGHWFFWNLGFFESIMHFEGSEGGIK